MSFLTEVPKTWPAGWHKWHKWNSLHTNHIDTKNPPQKQTHTEFEDTIREKQEILSSWPWAFIFKSLLLFWLSKNMFNHRIKAEQPPIG